MATMTQTRRTVKTARPFAVELVTLVARINGTLYHVEPIPAGEDGTAAFRLAKQGGAAVYDVVRDHHGCVACDCPDYEARHRGNGFGMCKHGRTMVGLGLVAAPKAPRQVEQAPTPAPAVAPAAAAAPKDARAVGALEPAGRSTPIDRRTLPRIDGTGLTREELFRVNGARNRARSIYAADCPEASPGELDRVADHAATDALRAVLRDRPAAPPLAGPAEGEAAPCCSPADHSPCGGCAAAAASERQDPEDTPERPGWLDALEGPGREPSAGETLTLAELIDREAARLRRMETHAGDLMARTLAELARTVRFVQARTPAELEARLEVLDRDHGGAAAEPEPELTASGTWA